MKLENENINVLYIYDCIKSLEFKVIWHIANMIAKVFFQFVRKQLVCLGYCKYIVNTSKYTIKNP